MIFFGLLLIASLFINGLYKISRHHIVIMPDGSKRVEGEFLKWFSAFIEQTKGSTAWQYQGEQLEEKFRTLIAADRKLKNKLEVAPERMSLILKPDQVLDKEERRFIDDILQARTLLNANALFLFLDMPKYVFPKWVRYPLISCVVCMASVWGSLFWWVAYFCGITSFEQSVTLIAWPIFCVSLSFINYLWAKKADF